MTFSIPWASLAGGILLGLSAILMLLLNGKVAGISGILAGLLKTKSADFSWRLLFVVGLISGGIWAASVYTTAVPIVYSSSMMMLAVAGFLVGVGTRLGNGCTSGHGICGIGRLSKRSIIATCVFMGVAALTVFLRLHVM
ncbi:YeeE/YedE family protein [Vibrio olivae]|uniref:YeeE/YedE family protein n=1 Tax=Vibrio olivae TaxID=1243002 RepID=A0ABV5HRK9_9VIBR